MLSSTLAATDHVTFNLPHSHNDRNVPLKFTTDISRTILIARPLSPFPPEMSRVIILRTRGFLFVATQSSCLLYKEDPNYNVEINTAIFNDFSSFHQNLHMYTYIKIGYFIGVESHMRATSWAVRGYTLYGLKPRLCRCTRLC